MFVAKSSSFALRAAFRTVRVAPTFRAFATESKALKREIISEKQIPVTAFKPDGPSSHGGIATPLHFKIPVGGAKLDPVAEQPQAVTPLSKAMYAKLPATLQKMTVMDKVIIVTG